MLKEITVVVILLEKHFYTHLGRFTVLLVIIGNKAQFYQFCKYILLYSLLTVSIFIRLLYSFSRGRFTILFLVEKLSWTNRREWETRNTNLPCTLFAELKSFPLNLATIALPFSFFDVRIRIMVAFSCVANVLRSAVKSPQSDRFSSGTANREKGLSWCVATREIDQRDCRMYLLYVSFLLGRETVWKGHSHVAPHEIIYTYMYILREKW